MWSIGFISKKELAIPQIYQLRSVFSIHKDRIDEFLSLVRERRLISVFKTDDIGLSFFI